MLSRAGLAVRIGPLRPAAVWGAAERREPEPLTGRTDRFQPWCLVLARYSLRTRPDCPRQPFVLPNEASPCPVY